MIECTSFTNIQKENISMKTNTINKAPPPAQLAKATVNKYNAEQAAAQPFTPASSGLPQPRDSPQPHPTDFVRKRRESVTLSIYYADRTAADELVRIVAAHNQKISPVIAQLTEAFVKAASKTKGRKVVIPQTEIYI